MLDIREERMSDAMVKWHIGGLQRAVVAHQFTAPDLGAPHDHPWPFHSFVVSGGYVEEVFALDGTSQIVRHEPGDAFYVPADHIHRIIELPNGACETIILPGAHERKSGFYEFRDGVAYHRFWDEPEFKRL